MAGNKEAIAVILDVSPSMCGAPHGEDSSLKLALETIQQIVRRKIFAESKDEIVIILFGTADSNNPLVDKEDYQNISIERFLSVVDFDLLEWLTKYSPTHTVLADFIDALVVAMDHFQSSPQDLKKFKHKQMILFSDLASPFADDQVTNIIASLSNQGFEFNVIGPELDDVDENGDCDAGEGITKKMKTKQQKDGEAIVKDILLKTNGASYSFEEALSMLNFFTSRPTKPMPWKCNLEVGSLLSIPICGYIKVKACPPKKSWGKVYAEDPSAEFKSSKTYHLNDEEETEVKETIDAYTYGSTLVPMSEDDKKSMKNNYEKCFKILGFTNAEKVPVHYYMGDSSLCVVSEPDNEVMAVALSALINALYETNSVAIVRRVYSARSAPRVGCLVPYIKTKFEYLMYYELPFSEDIRMYHFGSLPVDEDAPPCKRFKPSDDQLDAIDKLIDTMDLSNVDLDGDGDYCEVLKPKLTFNPYLQRLHQCLEHKAITPNEPLPELSPLIAQTLQLPPKITNQSKEALKVIMEKFKLELTSKKVKQTKQNYFKEKIDAESASKKMKVKEETVCDGIVDIFKSETTQVGSVNPIEDFSQLLAAGRDFKEVSQQMQKQIVKIVSESIGKQFYKKAIDCLKSLRKESIEKKFPKYFNNYLDELKSTFKARKDFWEEIIKEKQGLISKMECQESLVSLEEARDFFSQDQQVAKLNTSNVAESADDLLDEM